MKRLASLVLLLVFCFTFTACTAPSDLYGAWYVDENGIRNAIQFSENEEGKDVFIWAVYDIENDVIESNNRGYYKVSGDEIIFQYGEDVDNFTLEFVLDGDNLTLFSDTARLELTKYELD